MESMRIGRITRVEVLRERNLDGLEVSDYEAYLMIRVTYVNSDDGDSEEFFQYRIAHNQGKDADISRLTRSLDDLGYDGELVDLLRSLSQRGTPLFWDRWTRGRIDGRGTLVPRHPNDPAPKKLPSKRK